MKVFNSLSAEKEEFLPQGDEVKMYVCGINPYDDAHIGHALSYIFFDVVRRYLEFRGYRVKHVQNITDIEDNIITQANRLGVSVPLGWAHEALGIPLAEKDGATVPGAGA